MINIVDNLAQLSRADLLELLKLSRKGDIKIPHFKGSDEDKKKAVHNTIANHILLDLLKG